MKKKLLLAGGSHSDIPLILAAKRLGLHVTTGGNRPSELGHAYADAFEPFDYSNADELADVVTKIGADALCACCNDFAAISCSIVAHHMGFPGHDSPETAKIIHHKDLWRSFAQENAISTPRAIGCETLRQAQAAIGELRFPLMVKPVDLTGGKGISRADNPASAISAVNDAFAISKVKRIVVEEFVQGRRHGFSCLLKNGKVVFHFADDEYYHLSEYLVAAAYTPTSCPPKSIATLISESERISNLLALVDGILHIQFIQPTEGPPIIIEVCRRAPGDLYLDLVRHATGVAYSEYIVSAAAGLSWEPPTPSTQTRFITRHCLMADRTGIFTGFDFASSVATRIIDQLIWAKNGDVVSDPLTHKFGIVFVEHPDAEQMRREAPELQRLLFSTIV